MALTSWIRQDLDARMACLLDETKTSANLHIQVARNSDAQAKYTTYPLIPSHINLPMLQPGGTGCVSSRASAVPPPGSSVTLATAPRPGSPVSGRAQAGSRHTHVQKTFCDDGGFLACCGASEATVNGNTWQRGPRIDGGPTGRNMAIRVKRRCWGYAFWSKIKALNRNCHVDL